MDAPKAAAVVWFVCCILGTARGGRYHTGDADARNLSINFSNVSGGFDETKLVETAQRSDLKPQRLQPNIDIVTDDVERANSSLDRRSLSGYRRTSFNAIDRCWRGKSNWASNRKQLANCGFGFGSEAVGGKYGPYYVVTNPGDDCVNPAPGTLRYGVIQLHPLWIIFAKDMTITLENELIVTSDKTIDGRGANVHIAYGPCITLQNVENVIIHGLHIHDCKPGKAGIVRSSTAHVGHRLGCDGDGVSVFTSNNIWIDHNSFASCADGLTDVTHASTAVTISNNFFTKHDKVMLLGHSDSFKADKIMKVTVAFNFFGPGLEQRMPRCRFGLFHVVNNDYFNWEKYAVGGSSNPTIISAGNRYQAGIAKQVTKRDCRCKANTWGPWVWKSVGDTFVHGAFFVQSGGGGDRSMRSYGLPSSSKFAPFMTWDAGALSCVTGRSC